MSFDIHELDEIEYDGSSEAEEALEEYQDSLIEKFIKSPEGIKHQEKYSEIGSRSNGISFFSSRSYNKNRILHAAQAR